MEKMAILETIFSGILRKLGPDPQNWSLIPKKWMWFLNRK